MTQTPNQFLITIGRILLGLYFLVPGLMKFAAFDMHVELMVRHGVEPAAPLLLIAALVNVIGGLLLITNRFVKFTALGFAIYIVIINVMLHDFWNFEGVEGAHEMQNMIKNFGIMAGLLVLSGISPKRPLNPASLLKSDKAYL